MSLDEFTSVQWDRDDPNPQRIYNNEPVIAEDVEDSVRAEHSHDEHKQRDESVKDSSTIIDRTTAATDKSSNDEIYIKSTVSEPLRESDGTNSFITYLVKTTTNNPAFKSTNIQIRRRFSDFNFLYEYLLNDFPSVIVPPLPNKQRLEYIKGDRFSEHFTTKRAISLNNFLSRVSKHETLRNSKIYYVFLENTDYWNTYKQNLKLSGGGSSASSGTSGDGNTGNNESISDYIMNAFKRPSSETENSKEFQEITMRANKLQENLEKIDKVFSKVLRKQNDLSSNFTKFGEEFTKLNRLINDNTEEPSSDLDQALVRNFKALSDNVHKFGQASNTLTQKIDFEYLTSLRDLEHYIFQLKSAIKLKDSKLLDYEALVNYLNKAKHEKQLLLQNGSGSTAGATIKFLSRKVESLTGTDPGGYGSSNSVNNKILKLNSKIAKLETESEEALTVFQNFEKALLKDYYGKFETIKAEEIDENLQKLADFNSNFYTSVLKSWVALDDSLLSKPGPNAINNEESESDSINKAVQQKLRLNEDSEFFKHEKIAENEENINRDYDKLIQTHDERLKEKQEEAKRAAAIESQTRRDPDEEQDLEPVMQEPIKGDDTDEDAALGGLAASDLFT